MSLAPLPLLLLLAAQTNPARPVVRPPAPAVNPSQEFARGRTAFNRGEYARAIELLRPLLYPETAAGVRGGDRQRPPDAGGGPPVRAAERRGGRRVPQAAAAAARLPHGPAARSTHGGRLLQRRARSSRRPSWPSWSASAGRPRTTSGGGWMPCGPGPPSSCGNYDRNCLLVSFLPVRGGAVPERPPDQGLVLPGHRGGAGGGVGGGPDHQLRAVRRPARSCAVSRLAGDPPPAPVPPGSKRIRGAGPVRPAAQGPGGERGAVLRHRHLGGDRRCPQFPAARC